MNLRSRHLFATVATLLSLFALASCAKERPPINRVQPNALDKSMLAGEWYYQRTVVGTPAGTVFTPVGMADLGGVERVMWDIQENFLYARRTTELVIGADDQARSQAAGQPYRGEVIAAFAIQSHFDVAMSYNDVTGEQYNVRVENSSDRPWYERQYIRVDWSQNLVHNYDLDFEAQTVESVPYYVQEIDPITGQRNPDAPVFEPDGSYFDVTNKVFAAAATVDFPEYGRIPLCWLRGQEFAECGAGEYTIRQSFKKVDPNYQYEPLPYSGPVTNLFGFFATERMVYDDREGVREQRKERWINRYNLWQRSWDVVDGQKVPIPYADRAIKPIVYHVNQDWPADDADLNAAVRMAADQWNQAFSAAVRALGKDPGDQQVFILCPHNPVAEGDPAECGPAGTVARLGDLRYSFFAYIPAFDDYGLLGFGPSNHDPVTGEILSGSAHVYSANNRAAFQVMEMVQMLTGQLDPDAYIDGVNLENWVEQMTGRSEPAQRSFGLDDARHFVHRAAYGNKAGYWDGQRRTVSADDERQQATLGFRAWAEPYLSILYQRGIHNGETASALRTRQLAALKGTDIEQMMLGEDLYMGMGHDPSLPVTDSLVQQSSVVRGGLGKFVLQRQKFLDDYAEKRNLDLADMADDALIGLARDLASRGLSDDELYHEVRRTIYQAVITHECGHTIGLAHNFGASDDAINYFDRYWELRAADGTVGPRLNDPLTQQEIDGQIYSYAYSSIMDYASRYTTDGAGIGKYDRAAILFGYAQKVEVFDNNYRIPVSAFRDWWETDGDIIGFYNLGPRATHYTYFYNTMGPAMYDASNRALVDVTELDDTLSQANDGRMRVPYIFCSHTRSDLSDSCLTRDSGADSYERMKNILDDLNSWYIMRNFPRGQIGRSDDNFVDRFYPRVYHRLKKWHDIYGLYVDFLPMYYQPAQVEEFLLDPVEGWGAKTVAVQNAFNFLVQTLLMPDVGSYYGLVTQPDGTRLAEAYGASSGGFSVDVTGGRYYSTSWSGGNRDCGYFWWECLHHIGFYLDKIMAIEALSDSETNFVARSTPEDVREWEVSYYNTFADQLMQINRAIVANNWESLAPYWENNRIKFPNYAGDLSQAHSTPVNPMATFTVQLYWQVLGLTRFVDNFDPRFVDQSRIYYLGEGHDTAIPADRRAVFTDPVSGLSFTAVKYNQSGGDPGAGQSAIMRANVLLARSSWCDSAAVTAVTDDDCAELPGGVTKVRVDAELRDYVELLKVLVRLSDTIQIGSPYNP